MIRLACLPVILLIALSSHPAQAQEKVRIANEGDIRNAWMLPPGSKLPVPGYPAGYSDDQAEVCVAVGYLINPDGHTSDFALLKSWSAQEPSQGGDRYWGEFARGASAALSQWRFIPKPEVGVPRPVYTVATFVFASPNLLESSKRCAIPNLSQRIVELRQDSRASRRMSASGVFDRLDLDPTLEARYRGQTYLRNSEVSRNQPPALPRPQPPTPTPPSGG
ncbi:MAG: hypothetical protein ABIP87_10170 [Thermomonas sp.]